MSNRTVAARLMAKRFPLRVLLVQMGARRRYELAHMLTAHGALAGLQTDAAWTPAQPPGRIARTLLPGAMGAADRRTVVGVPPGAVRSTPLPNIAGAVLRAARVGMERRYRIEDWFLGLDARCRGLDGANVVLNTAGNGGLTFLEWARRNGAKVASDIVITPRALEIVAEERARWPGWETGGGNAADIAVDREHIRGLVAVSDLLICPSQGVLDGLRTVPGFDERKAVIVPYALGGTLMQRGTPQPKRVLFAGQAGLRKGLPYLAEAARILKARDPEIDVRVAGSVTPTIRARPECAALNFLGHLGPAEMANEYRSASVYCLPSLAEGMAGSVLEALAYALPCVVTRSAGAPPLDGVAGFEVPERDGEALAQAITRILSDSELREEMSRAASSIAEHHTVKEIGRRLCESLATIV